MIPHRTNTTTTAGADEANPYRSPLTPGVVAPPNRGGFPWRIFLVVVFCLYGGFALLLGGSGLLFVPGLLSGGVALGGHASLSKILLWTSVHAAVAAHGAAFAFAARNAWKVRWKQAAIDIGIAVAIALVALAICAGAAAITAD
jgi:hypothetical protein